MKQNGHIYNSPAAERIENRRLSRAARRVLTLHALGLLLLMIISGCSKAPAQTSVKAVAATQSWNWESYPLVDKMRLGLLPCRVQPRSSTTINSPFTGLLRIYVDRAQTNIPAGFIWGEFEPKLLDATSKALAEDKRRIEEREEILLALELPKQKLKIFKDIEEAQRQVALLEMLTTNKTLAPLVVGLMGLKDRSLTEETLRRSREELQVMRQNLRYLQATNLAAIVVDTQVQRT